MSQISCDTKAGNQQLKKNIANFRIGDTVRVHTAHH